MASALDVAKYFLTFSDEDSGDLISNLKLQKLIYYAQGFHLALFDGPLFDDAIDAWQHGPVVPEVYRAYRAHGGQGIPAPTDFDPSVFSQDQIDMMNEVYSVYGQFSAWKLRNMTHEESPWKDCAINEEIPQGAMLEYFKTRLN